MSDPRPAAWADRPCLGTDLFLWFGPADDQPEETPTDRRWRENVAKSVCAGCSVVAECLADELRQPVSSQWGVRGGLSEAERRALLRERRRAA